MTTKDKIIEITKGITEMEVDSPNGWWETSTGANFGADVLEKLLTLYDNDRLEINQDIRNKLSPVKNLVSLLETFFDDQYDPSKREKIVQHIRKEMNRTSETIEYLAKL